MEIRNVRFNESCGMACGPVCGDTGVEVMFFDDENKSFFVYASIFDCDLQVGVYRVSVFDIISNWMDADESELDRAKTYFEVFNDYYVDEVDESKGEILDFGEYTQAVKIALNVLHDYLESENLTEEVAKKKYIKKSEKELDCDYHCFQLDEEDEE